MGPLELVKDAGSKRSMCRRHADSEVWCSVAYVANTGW